MESWPNFILQWEAVILIGLLTVFAILVGFGEVYKTLAITFKNTNWVLVLGLLFSAVLWPYLVYLIFS